MSIRSRNLAAAGVAVTALYLSVIWVSISMGWIAARPLYDGMVPQQPYRWIAPPAERAADNQTPAPETFKVALRADGTTDPASVTTGDGQATVTFDLISPLKGPAFDVTVTPLDASKVAAAPADTYFDGNAYQVAAAYEGTKEPVDGAFTVVLKYSVHARRLLTLQNASWQSLFQPLATPIDLQVSARTPALGTFVAAGSGARPATGSKHSDEPLPAASSSPYRWVKPPSGGAKGNEIPAKESFKVRIDSFGQTELSSVATSDGQAEVSFGYIPDANQPELDVMIEPKDPGNLVPPPAGLAFEGNAYSISSIFPNGSAVSTIPTAVTLRYVDKARHLLMLSGDRWVELASPNIARTGNFISARTAGPGTYVAAANRGDAPKPPASAARGPLPWILSIGALIVLIAVAVPMSKRKSKPEIVKTDPDKL